MRALLDDLEARGLIQDSTDLTALEDAGPVTLYYGCDPTADSLHVGNMIGLLVLRRFAEAGHRPIALVGGSTGMIGDPGGRSEERNLLDAETLEYNVGRIRAQVEAISGAALVNNFDWTGDVALLDFLRDVGKHVTVNQMIAKDSVKSRLDSEHGISFTEFSYQLLQAFDFWHLHEHEDCVLQIGGSDQWGNLVAGVDLVRKRSGGSVHAFTWPLITRADGTKFGKSMGANIWLAADRTSPYKLFQYFVNTDDRDLRRFLAQLTLVDLAEIDALVRSHEADPGRREAQRRLAREVTTLVHGAAATAAAEEASAILFGGDPSNASVDAWETIIGEVDTTGLAAGHSLAEGVDPVAMFVAAGLASSNGDARRQLDQGSLRVSGRQLSPGDQVTESDLRHGRFLLLRKGKRHFAAMDLEKDPVSG